MRTRLSSIVEAIYRREVWPWALLGVTTGLVEGATIAVLVKKSYAGVVDSFWLNLAVAVLSGASALANITSFAWANFVHGRARVSMLSGMQVMFALLVGLIALVPFGPGGLLLTVTAVVAARILWAGILTTRAAVWTANFPRSMMARMTGRILVISMPGFALTSLCAGWLLDQGAEHARWLYAVAALCGLLAAWRYRAVRVRREFRLLEAETAAAGKDGPFSLGMLRRILDRDPSYKRFMFCMSLFGAGNLMMNAQLVICFSDRLHLPGFLQIVLLTVVPYVLMPMFLPMWARMFDGGHVVEYRARQCWVLVVATGVTACGVWFGWLPLLWLGAVLAGVANAGANLGWNLGHNDFAPRGQAQHYMGVHVTLTGVRGLIAPPLGILLYEALEHLHTGWGVWALFAPMALLTSGGLGFVRMREERAAS
jgi:MFS family permease